jgi:hypothetical protein
MHTLHAAPPHSHTYPERTAPHPELNLCHYCLLCTHLQGLENELAVFSDENASPAQNQRALLFYGYWGKATICFIGLETRLTVLLETSKALFLSSLPHLSIPQIVPKMLSAPCARTTLDTVASRAIGGTIGRLFAGSVARAMSQTMRPTNVN